jgi:hypothetical protein
MATIEVDNDGQNVVSSTYWGSEYELAGKVFASCNAGAVRLLIPLELVREVKRGARKAKYVIISRGPWPEGGKDDGVELLWEDKSDTPYSIQLSPESFDLLPGDPGPERAWVVTVWTQQPGSKGPTQLTWHDTRYRRVPHIPYLKPWGD